ncbi:hypothetical protein HTT03_15255 [Sulfitobacter sp. S0837]|uniref:hypothetical protein n=1 Tax=Sulfitobacter maritimus TaxID=2741719 RepID=UPI0015825A6B|nr:hypothetical protein [Sulfitobacter maritimus]NUH66638.1 hypothetical protein [Sulfitobacter maritimus]
MKRTMGPLFGSDNLDVESNEIAWKRASTIFGFVFSVIQAGLVLGLLKAGMFKFESDLLLLLWLSGFIALGVYILTGSNYVIAMLFDRYNWRNDRKLVRVVFRLVTGFCAVSVPYLISGLTSDIIVQALK